MKSKRLKGLKATALTVFSLLVVQNQLAAQGNRDNDQVKQHHYKLIDMGTFGGPASAFNGGRMMNSRGLAVGASETSVPDSAFSNGWPCGPGTFVYHAFEYQNNGVTDLGSLPGNDHYCSNANSINAQGDIVGNSEIRSIDPALGTHEIRAVYWKDGRIQNLGTLGGKQSAAGDINDAGEITGFATNQVADQWSMFYLAFGNPNGTQTRAFLWQNGAMQDLGTLGGADAMAALVNERGQVTGVSFTNSTPNSTTGIPTQDPFFWDNGQITDIGSLGGTLGQPTALNNRGQVAGGSNLAGDLTQHAFLWDHGNLTDLGTLGGTFSTANCLNEEGDVVGFATVPGDNYFHATLWRGGQITDLGTLPGDCFSLANGINSHEQIVGQSFSCDGSFIREVLWEQRSIIDLSTLILAGPNLLPINPMGINERGEIVGKGVPPGCNSEDQCGHAFVMIPSPDTAAVVIPNSAEPPAVAIQHRLTARDLVTKFVRPQQGAMLAKHTD